MHLLSKKLVLQKHNQENVCSNKYQLEFLNFSNNHFLMQGGKLTWEFPWQLKDDQKEIY